MVDNTITNMLIGDSMSIHTSKGFDQENNAPDKASETQSTGVPEYKNQHQSLLL